MTRITYLGGVSALHRAQLDLETDGTVTALLVLSGTTIDLDDPPIEPIGYQDNFTQFGTLDEVLDPGYSRQTLSNQQVVGSTFPEVEVRDQATSVNFGDITAASPPVVGILLFLDGAADVNRKPCVAYVRPPDFPETQPDGNAFIVDFVGGTYWVSRKEP